MITVALGFLAIGYFAGGAIADRRKNPADLFIILGFTGAGILAGFKFAVPILLWSDRFGMIYGPLVAVSIIYFLPFLLLGMVTPMLVRLSGAGTEHTGASAGRIIGTATFGSLFGALSAGFILLPNFSLKIIFGGMAAALIVLSILIALMYRTQIAKGWGIAVIFALLLVIFLPVVRADNSGLVKVIYEKPSYYADIKVAEAGKSRCLIVDGVTQTCMELGVPGTSFSALEEIKRIVEAMPEDKTVLILGLGGGSLSAETLQKKHVDAVELVPEILETAEKYFGFNEDMSTNVIIDDARSYLRTSAKKYDIIIADTFFASSIPSHLLTKEYFELMRDRLNPDGLVLFNLIGRNGPEDKYTASYVKTLKAVFPNIMVTAPGLGLQNMVIHASNDLSYAPDLPDMFEKVVIDTDRGIILTDQKNPAESLAVSNLEALRKNMKSFAGYDLFFSN